MEKEFTRPEFKEGLYGIDDTVVTPKGKGQIVMLKGVTVGASITTHYIVKLASGISVELQESDIRTQ